MRTSSIYWTSHPCLRPTSRTSTWSSRALFRASNHVLLLISGGFEWLSGRFWGRYLASDLHKIIQSQQSLSEKHVQVILVQAPRFESITSDASNNKPTMLSTIYPGLFEVEHGPAPLV